LNWAGLFVPRKAELRIHTIVIARQAKMKQFALPACSLRGLLFFQYSSTASIKARIGEFCRRAV